MREKWNSRSLIFDEVTNNYSALGHRLVGPIKIQIRNNKTIVITGECESDYLLMCQGDWLKTSFDKQRFSMEVDKIQSYVSEIMLMGTTRSTISPNGEEAIKKN